MKGRNTRRDAWTESEDKILIESFLDGAEHCAKLLPAREPPRTIMAIKSRAQVLGVQDSRPFSRLKEPGEQSAISVYRDPIEASKLRIYQLQEACRKAEAELARHVREHYKLATKLAKPDMRARRVA